MSRRKKNIAVDLIECEDTPSGGFGIVVTPEGGGADTTNNRSIIQPKSSAGSGGPLTNADLQMHTGPCTLNRIIGSCTTGGTIAISDATGAPGTAIVTFTFVASTNPFSIDMGGLAFGTGIYFDLTTFVGSVMVCVGPAVS